jgi:hypothetical protein
MQGGERCHRTLRLAPVTETVLRGPGVSLRVAEHCAKLRVEYRPDCVELQLMPVEDVLFLTVGGSRLRKLSAALAQVEIGGMDFSIAPSHDKHVEGWWFW